MTPEEQSRMNDLFKRLQEEKDRKVFDDLVDELNKLVGIKAGRLRSQGDKKKE